MKIFMIWVILGNIFTSQFLLSIGHETSINDKRHYEIITAGQLLKKIDNNENFLLMDCRPQEEYLAGHIPGAVNVSFDSFTFQQETVLRKSIQEVQNQVGKEIDFILIDGITEVPYMSISKMKEFSSHLPGNRNATLVFYCRRTDCTRSPMASRWAAALGYKKICRYPGGLEEWKEFDYPLVLQK